MECRARHICRQISAIHIRQHQPHALQLAKAKSKSRKAQKQESMGKKQIM